MNNVDGASLLVALAMTIILSAGVNHPREQKTFQANAQSKTGGGAEHDHRLFECNDNDLESNKTGCQLVGQKHVAKFSGPLFWHLTRFPSKKAAEASLGPIAFVVNAEDQYWLFSFGARDAAPRQGKTIAHIGPLPMASADAYEIVAYRVVMPPGAYTQVHKHPGPEAWYILDGQQCLETPAGIQRARAGETMMAPPNTPMRLTNSGSVIRRAFFIIIHDAAQPSGSPVSTWKPTGVCDR